MSVDLRSSVFQISKPVDTNQMKSWSYDHALRPWTTIKNVTGRQTPKDVPANMTLENEGRAYLPQALVLNVLRDLAPRSYSHSTENRYHIRCAI